MKSDEENTAEVSLGPGDRGEETTKGTKVHKGMLTSAGNFKAQAQRLKPTFSFVVNAALKGRSSTAIAKEGTRGSAKDHKGRLE
jgi:hypothetical protein